ncbi:hypothetical protein [Rhizobium mongolense]|uniref:Uncharacterized protein n=2 Tax=Rhizobium mongolense TaxID=57676 RepID=A0ABR6IWH0_9HYPH|nr:hypothetical protein [Rhizobium mongolense]MBB4232267.1 hypothetical protein [Rhizobium mongolense]TVZ63021.1 hypothetical protein BCL32_3130 [Rhizobium mongolense USDA 1844]
MPLPHALGERFRIRRILPKVRELAVLADVDEVLGSLDGAY